MQFFLLSAFSFLFSTVTHAATRTWDGEAMNNRWDDPVNWSGDVVPVPGDDVLLDNTVVAASYEVVLPEGDLAISVNRLEILPDAGCTIRLLLPAGNISPIAFRATAEGDAVILHRGSVFINESGATVSSTPVAVTGIGYFRINNGARYVHRTARSATDNLVSRLSAEPGTETGVFEFDVTVSSYIISLSGRTFGSLELNSSANASLVSYRGSGGNIFHVRGWLRLHPAVSFTLSLSSETIIGGMLQLDGSSVFNLQSTDNHNLVRIRGDILSAGTITESGTGNPVLVMDGAITQSVSVGSAALNQVTFRFDNPEGFVLQLPLQITYGAELLRGVVRSSAAGEFQFGPEATCIRDAGVVEGPVRKFRPAGFVFPVGSGTIYAPLSLDVLSGINATDELAVAYHRSNPQSVIGNTIGPGDGPVDHISNVEFWSMDGSNGLIGRITCTLTPMSFSRTLAGTFITQHMETMWSRKATSVTAGPFAGMGYESGELGTVNIIPLRGFISPGSALGFAENPLPLGLLSFTAVRTGVNEAVLEWTTSEAGEKGTRFFIGLRSPGQDTLFRPLVVVEAKDGIDRYRTGGLQLVPGLNQFRISVVEPDGRMSASRLTNIQGEGSDNLQLLSLYPNPVSGMARLKLWSARKGKTILNVLDVLGRNIQSAGIHLEPGVNEHTLRLQGLPEGYYVLELISDDGVPARLAFIRR
ncbi:MAG: T9SS type A sorting domain-containing protein [Chitinophagaceae bacterium]|nr:MAG: T9SS type A sorting domain-containing protein [Chitinophagaceae bacterium]